MDAIPLGKDLKDEILYVARAEFPNGVHCGKYRIDWECAHISYGG